jgi:multidrug efflux system outer membrane protein
MRPALVLAVAIAAAGCKVGPNYQRPTNPVTAGFRGQPRAEAASFADLPWWELIRDPDLAALVREALEGSYDLQDAIARMEVARQNANASEAALFPELGVALGPSYQQVFLGAISGLNAPGLPTGNIRYPHYLLQATVSWDIDLWGRLRRLREAALAQFLASEEHRRAVIVSLVGDIAQGYFNLQALDLQLAIARRTVASRQETLVLFRDRERGGVGSALDTASEEALLAGARATIPDLERQIAQAENQLSTLIGRPPGPVRRGLDLAHQPPPPDPPVGMPASVLERRPDVRQAEAFVMAANAEVGAAFANLLPSLSFTGNVGVEGSSLEHLFTGRALTYLASGLLSDAIPVLNGAQKVYGWRGQQASYVVAVVAYRRTVLTALSEVANALVALKTYREARVQLEAQVAAQVESLRLAKERFTNGVASYLDVVQAEQNLFPSELTLAQTIGAQFASLTELYRALGGGWQARHTTAEATGSAAPGPAAAAR